MYPLNTHLIIVVYVVRCVLAQTQRGRTKKVKDITQHASEVATFLGGTKDLIGITGHLIEKTLLHSRSALS
jgi:hypothetical protein